MGVYSEVENYQIRSTDYINECLPHANVFNYNVDLIPPKHKLKHAIRPPKIKLTEIKRLSIIEQKYLFNELIY